MVSIVKSVDSRGAKTREPSKSDIFVKLLQGSSVVSDTDISSVLFSRDAGATYSKVVGWISFFFLLAVLDGCE
jgi:hypothetical protein